MNRDLRGEGTETDDLLPEPPTEDPEALRAEAARVRSKLDTCSSPGWDLMALEWMRQREGHYRALGSAVLADLAQISLVRGQVAMLDSLLSAKPMLRADLDEIEQALRQAEPEMQEA